MRNFSQLVPPRFKHYGIILGSALVLVVLIFATSQRHDTAENQKTEPDQQSVDFTGIPPKELTLNRISADLERMHQQQQVLHAQHQKEMDSLRERVQQDIKRLHQSEPVQQPVPVVENHHPEPMPDVLQWSQYNQPPPVSYNEPDYYETPPQPPKPIRMLGATFTPASTSDSKTEEPPKLLRLTAGSIFQAN